MEQEASALHYGSPS